MWQRTQLSLPSGGTSCSLGIDFTPQSSRAGGAAAKIRAVGDVSGNAGLSLWTATGGSAAVAVERVRIGTDGNVGIGTTLPTNALHVRANTTTAGVVIDQTGTGGILDVRDGGVSKVVVDGAGNVGIGITNPQATMHVNGDVKMSGYLLKPFSVYVMAHNNALLGLVDGGIIQFTRVSINQPSNAWSITLHRFIAPISGYYKVDTSLLAENNYEGNHEIFKNNSSTGLRGFGFNSYSWLGGGHKNATSSFILYLNTNEFIDVRSIGLQYFYGSPIYGHTTICIHLLG